MTSVLLAVDLAGASVDRRLLEKLWEQRNAGAFAHGRRGRTISETAKSYLTVAIETVRVWFPSTDVHLKELAFPALNESRRD